MDKVHALERNQIRHEKRFLNQPRILINHHDYYATFPFISGLGSKKSPLTKREELPGPGAEVDDLLETLLYFSGHGWLID